MPANRINLEKLALFLKGKDPNNELIKHNLFLTEDRPKRLLAKLDWSFSYTRPIPSLEKIFEDNPDKFVPGAHSNHYDKLFTEIFTSTYYFNNSVEIIEADRIREAVIAYFNYEEGVLKNGFRIDKYGKINTVIFEDIELEELFKSLGIEFDHQEVKNCIDNVAEFTAINASESFILRRLSTILEKDPASYEIDSLLENIKRVLKKHKEVQKTKPS